MRVRVYYKDTDCGGIVYHSRYFDFCEMARSELFFSNNQSPIKDNCHFAIKNIKANFIKPARLGDMLDIKTKLLKLKYTSFSLEHQIFKDENLIFQMEILLVNLCKDGKVHKIDEQRKSFLLSVVGVRV